MQWRGILARLKHAHTVSLSSASVSCPTKAGHTTVWSSQTSRSSLQDQVRAASISARKPVVKNIVSETSSSSEPAKVSSSPQPKSRPVTCLDIQDTETISQKSSKSENGSPTIGKTSKTDTVPEGKQTALFKKSEEDRKGELHGAGVGDCGYLAEDSSTLGDIGAREDAIEFECGQTLENDLSNDPSSAIVSEGGEVSGEEFGDGFKKGYYIISFPVSIMSEWWRACFIRNVRTYGSLHHPLFKIHVWLAAYQRVHRDATGRYTDGQSAIVLMRQLRNIQDSVSRGSFRWSDDRNIYLSHPVVGSEEEKSKIPETDVNPSFQDNVVQEVLYLVLEPIFEKRFSARSHACRPGRDVCTALEAVKSSCSGCNWFVTGHLAILRQEAYANHLVDHVLRFVRDPRITFLLKSGFVGKGIRNQNSHSNLRELLCNAFLDQLDWWMDEQFLSHSKREQSSLGVSSRSSSKAAHHAAERPRKLEYVRYGTEFLVACNGSEGDARVLKQNIELFFQQRFGWDAPSLLQISHVSAGVPFLDHIISQKVVRRVVLRRKSSNGRVFDKRDVRIRLCFRASKESCLLNLQKVRSPTVLQDIKKILSVLRYWYHCAENKERLMDYCRFMLCLWYAKETCRKDEGRTMDQDLARCFNEAMEMVSRDNVEDDGFITSEDTCDWVEYEKVLRSYAWLQDETIMTQVKNTLQKMQSLPSQQHMSQIVCRYLSGGYGVKGDNGWDLESQMQSSNGGEGLMAGLSDEELSQSMG